MFQNPISLNAILSLLSMSIICSSNAQNSLKLEEIQTYYSNGKLKSIEKTKFNETGNITRLSRYKTIDNSLYLHQTVYDSLNRPIKEESSKSEKKRKRKLEQLKQKRLNDNKLTIQKQACGEQWKPWLGMTDTPFPIQV